MAIRGGAGLVLVVVALLALAISGCGGGGDDSEAAATGLAETDVAGSTAVEAEPPPQPAQPTVVVELRNGRPIGPGASGEHVAALQTALKQLGYNPGKPDGSYGPETRKAIVAFQKDFKLGADGLVGQKTAKKMNEELRKAAGGTG